MRIKISVISILLCLFQNVQGQSQSKFDRVFNQVVQAISEVTGQLREVTTQTIEVNSIMKARFSNGHTRQVVPVNLPRGTEKWYYRITVMDVKSTYSYQNNETFFYDLKNHISVDNLYQPTNSGVDFFILGTSGDASSFGETGNNNFTYYDGYQRLQSNSFYGEGSGLTQADHPNLWIGIRNDNKVDGLRVIVEVVAWGHFY